MKTFNQFRSDSDATALFAGLDKEASYVDFIGLNKDAPLFEVYDGGKSSDFPPEGDEYIHHYNHSIQNPSESTKAYTSHLSIAVNQALIDHYKRGDQQSINGVKHHVAEIDSDLIHVHAKNDLVLYSGFGASPMARSGEWHPTRTSKVVHLPAYTSTSTNLETAVRFTVPDTHTQHIESDHHGLILPNARHVVKINVPEGTNGIASVRNVSTNMHENEFLLARGHSIVLHHRPTAIHNEYRNPVYVWHADVFSKNPSPHKL